MLVALTGAALVLACFLIHHDVLYRLTRWLPRRGVPSRWRVMLAALAAMAAHVVEIFLFGLAYGASLVYPALGRLGANYDENLGDCIYFSFTTYTSLGIGDVEPFGPLRTLAGIESLVGLMLIAWTASFLYVEMKQSWRSARQRRRQPR